MGDLLRRIQKKIERVQKTLSTKAKILLIFVRSHSGSLEKLAGLATVVFGFLASIVGAESVISYYGMYVEDAEGNKYYGAIIDPRNTKIAFFLLAATILFTLVERLLKDFNLNGKSRFDRLTLNVLLAMTVAFIVLVFADF